MKSLIATTPCGPVEYTLAGSGPVVLYCHGTSCDCFSTGGSEALVNSGFSVLTPSRPGYGRTPLATGGTAAQAADALASLLDCLGIPACSVLAVSGGGPTGIALAARHPRVVQRLALAAAISRPETRAEEASYRSQMAFYGPLHPLMWGMLGLMSRLSPASMARQTLTLFSTHDPQDTLRQLTPEDVRAIARFYQGHSARRGALADAAHTVDEAALGAVLQPTLVIHSREDRSVPFSHAEWSLAHIPQAGLVEGGVTGHFFWIGPDAQRLNQELVQFLGNHAG